MVVRTGHTSLLLRDALRRPLLEVELGEVESGLRRLSGNVLQVGLLCMQCFHEFNVQALGFHLTCCTMVLQNTLPCPLFKLLELLLNAICPGK